MVRLIIRIRTRSTRKKKKNSDCNIAHVTIIQMKMSVGMDCCRVFFWAPLISCLIRGIAAALSFGSHGVFEGVGCVVIVCANLYVCCSVVRGKALGMALGIHTVAVRLLNCWHGWQDLKAKLQLAEAAAAAASAAMPTQRGSGGSGGSSSGGVGGSSGANSGGARASGSSAPGVGTRGVDGGGAAGGANANAAAHDGKPANDDDDDMFDMFG
jgi:hypothetical protein